MLLLITIFKVCKVLVLIERVEEEVFVFSQILINMALESDLLLFIHLTVILIWMHEIQLLIGKSNHALQTLFD